MMTNNPLISIIIPVYNVGKYLPKCIDSVVSQTYQNIEIVLIDDGSTDDSSIICDDYARKDNRIKVIHKENEGVTQARIDGFEYSSGELISFIDADDYIDRMYIEKLFAPFMDYDIDLSICRNKLVKYGDIIDVRRSVRGYLSRQQIDTMLSERYLFDRNIGHAGLPVYMATKLIKREFVKDALEEGKDFWYGEDQLASFYILTHITSMYALDEHLYYYVKYYDGRQASEKFYIDRLKQLFAVYEKYRQLDYKNLLQKNQLPLKMWWDTILSFRSAKKTVHSFRHFRKDMRQIDRHKMWREMFRKMDVPVGKKQTLAFILLRYRLYYIFYKLLFNRL